MAGIDKTADAAYNLCWARGDDDPRTFTLTDATGAPVDISTWTIRMAVSTELNPADVSALLFSVVGTLLTDGTDGKVVFTPPATALDAVSAPGVGYYDISRVSPSKKTLLKGTVEFVQDIDKT